MRSLVQKFLFVGLVLAIALPIAAQDKEKKRKKKGAQTAGPIAQLKKSLEKADLTAEQQKKVDDAIAKHRPKIEEAAEKAGDAPRRVNEARKKLQGEGKKGRELKDAVNSEAKLTDEEAAAVEQLNNHSMALRNEVASILTDEQKEKANLGQKGKKRKNQ